MTNQQIYDLIYHGIRCLGGAFIIAAILVYLGLRSVKDYDPYPPDDGESM